MKKGCSMKIGRVAVVFFVFMVCMGGYGVPAADALEIGVAWIGKSSMSPKILSGLEEELSQIAPGAKLDVRKELGSEDELAAAVSVFDATKDAMVILRSSGAKWLIKHPTRIPTFIGGCNHPGHLGVIDDISAPGGNITGVTYFVPFETEFEVFRSILPNLQSVLLLVEKGHPSSPIEQNGTREACAKMGIDYSEKVCASAAEAAEAAAQFSGKVSAIVIGTQAELTLNTQKIADAAGKTPLLAFSSKPVKSGALGGVAANDAKLGRMLAHSVVDVLVKGKSISSVPVKVDPKPNLSINVKTADRIGVQIPYDTLALATLIE